MGVNLNQIFHWRKLARIGVLTAVSAVEVARAIRQNRVAPHRRFPR
jgi:hypothetical protein